MAFENYEVWFVTGAQLLYGGDAVIAVDAHSNEIVKGLNESGNLPVKIVYKGTVNSAKEVTGQSLHEQGHRANSMPLPADSHRRDALKRAILPRRSHH